MKGKFLQKNGLKSLLVAITLMFFGMASAQDFASQKIVKSATSIWGYYTAAAVDANGNLWTWGSNSGSQLGTGNTTNQTAPFHAGGTMKFKDVSCGYQHIMALDTAGNIWACGSDTYGQIGDGATTAVNAFKQITTGTVYTQISAGMYSSMALDATGAVWAWGRNNKYQVGNNAATTANVTTPTKLTVTDGTPAATVEFTQISAGSYEMFAIDKVGNLWAWGDNASNGLGFVDPVTTVTTYKMPLKENFGGKLFQSVSGGDSHALACDTEGNLWSWGLNDKGQLGTGIFSWDATTSKVANKITTSGIFKKVKAGGANSFAFDNTGKMYAWGDNSSNLLGFTSASNHYTPEWVNLGFDVAAICPGGTFTTALDTKGYLYSWGKDNSGQLGDGDVLWGQTNNTFTKLATGLVYDKVIVGASHVAATTSTGDYYTWGSSQYAQLGTGSFGNVQTPQLVPSNNKGYKQLSSFGYQTLGLDANNQIWAWGYNRYGECAQDTLPTFELNPKQITSKNDKATTIASFKSINTGDYRGYVIDNTDRLWVFGQSTNGCLATSTTSTVFDTLHQVIVTPDAGVTNIDKFVFATGGSNMSVLIDINGQLWTAGNQQYGQLGNGVVATTNILLFTPIIVKENDVPVVFVSASCGSSHTLAIDNKGNVWAWGRNNYGQLGDGTLVDVAAPKKILDGTTTPYTSVLARSSYSFAITSTNKLFGWGYSGSLGMGDLTTNTLTATAILADKNIKGIYGGSSIRAALETTGDIYLTASNSNGELGNGLAWVSTPKKLNTTFVSTAVSMLHASDVNAYGATGRIVVNNQNTDLTNYTVYNMLGVLVSKGRLQLGENNVSMKSGMYIVRTGSFATKVLVP